MRQYFILKAIVIDANGDSVLLFVLRIIYNLHRFESRHTQNRDAFFHKMYALLTNHRISYLQLFPNLYGPSQIAHDQILTHFISVHGLVYRRIFNLKYANTFHAIERQSVYFKCRANKDIAITYF